MDSTNATDYLTNTTLFHVNNFFIGYLVSKVFF